MAVCVIVVLMPWNCPDIDCDGTEACEVCMGERDFEMIDVTFHANPNDPLAIDKDEGYPF
jgi:hypothetical protein